MVYGVAIAFLKLALSEIMTITVAFHLSPDKNFKTFDLGVVGNYWRDAFRGLSQLSSIY